MPPEKGETKEAQPGSYEYALELFRHIKENDLDKSFDEDSPKIMEAQDALDSWERAEGLGVGGIGDLERAKKFVKSARIFLEAGHKGKQVMKDLKERLHELYAMAMKEQDPEVIAYVSAELESVEPKSKIDKLIEDRLAKEVFGATKPSDAYATLHIMLYSEPRLKRMNEQQRARLEKLKEEYKLKS